MRRRLSHLWASPSIKILSSRRYERTCRQQGRSKDDRTIEVQSGKNQEVIPQRPKGPINGTWRYNYFTELLDCFLVAWARTLACTKRMRIYETSSPPPISFTPPCFLSENRKVSAKLARTFQAEGSEPNFVFATNFLDLLPI